MTWNHGIRPGFGQSDMGHGLDMDWGHLACLVLVSATLNSSAFANTSVLCELASRTESRKVSRFGPCLLVINGVCPDSKFVKFFLFTRLAPSGVELHLEEDADILSNTTFNPEHPTKIAVHGWGGNGSDFIRLLQAYLSIGFYNVIVVDYVKISAGLVFCYPFAVRNTAHVGRCVAHLVQRLRQTTAREFHVIGFSLGAHIAALAARELRPYILSRITGLDPAKPLFSTAGLDGRLDPSDAVFVDVMHTSSGAQGMVRPSGHVDFYVNGGSMQPGCGNTIKAYVQGCNHRRALHYFSESINSTVGFWGWTCQGHLEAFTGRCYPKLPATLMGEHTPVSSRGMVQCNTRQKRPYALGPWLREDFLLPPLAEVYFHENDENELVLFY